MRSGLTVGAEAELVWQVAAEHVIHLGYPPPSPTSGFIPEREPAPGVSAVVFSTPNMILLMERAARKVLEPFLEQGEVSVGASVQIEHMAGTPLGAEVCGVARVTSVDGRSIGFDVAAFDRHEQIGGGTHRRAVVRLERVAQRIAEKAGHGGADVPLSWMDGVAEPPAASDQNHPSFSENAVSPAIPSQPVPLPDTGAVQVELHGAIATVRLNRPKKKNAVNVQMTEDWERLNHFFSNHPEILPRVFLRRMEPSQEHDVSNQRTSFACCVMITH